MTLAFPAPPRPDNPSGRWTAARKLAVLNALDAGELTPAIAADRFGFSEEEIASWRRRYRRHGARGLNNSQLQATPRDVFGGDHAIPIEQALARTSSIMAEVIQARLGRGVRPVGLARVFERDGWTFAQVRYLDLQDLVFRLDRTAELALLGKGRARHGH